ncbi:MAG: CobW family GTP-binding protein [Polaromonas sp.]
MSTAARIPLTVIGGFLGAGKTTLLNRLLRNAGGRRMAVLVNDFGALNIDAELVASNAGDTVALTNGCVCCSIGDDLSAALIGVLAAATPFDAVVIEASGVSDPWRIAQIGLAAPELRLEGVIVLADAGALLEQSRDPLLADALQRQLKAADLVLLNKTDLADAPERLRVREWIAAVAGAVPLFETVQADLPLPLLGGLALPDRPGQVCTAAACGHAHAAQACSHRHDELFETWSLRPEGRYSVPALRLALAAMPAGVLRLKGLLRTDEHGWSELQFCGRHGSLRRAHGVPENGAALVAIGLRGQLPGSALAALFSDAMTPA